MIIPYQYRTVAFTTIGGDLSQRSLEAYFATHPVYRRTRFVVARSGGLTALLEVDKDTSRAGTELFCPVNGVTILAGPDDTVLVTRPTPRCPASWPGWRRSSPAGAAW
jgi:hypothetical protein